jgi:hypothetical protein
MALCRDGVLSALGELCYNNFFFARSERKLESPNEAGNESSIDDRGDTDSLWLH